jgi:serine protease Do
MSAKLAYTSAFLVCSFLGGAFAEWLCRATPIAAAKLHPVTDGERSPAELLSDRFQATIGTVGPAVVAIDAIKPPSSDPTARGKAVEESGSGVLVRWPGVSGVLAITNNHVVGAAEPSKVYVTLSDGRIVQPVKIWADPESDISLLQIANDSLPTAELGDSDRVRRGQWVLAFGSPFGLNQTVTHGIISATDRGQINLGSTIRIKEFLQTDASINPGSSGGPLVDLNGRVIGINTAIASKSGENSGVSFSIPANLVKRVATQLIEKGAVRRGYLGVQLASTLEPAEAIRLGLNRVAGAYIEIVHAGTPAEAAGLRVGDVILKVEGVPIRDENHLINLVTALPPGQQIKLEVWRERRTLTTTVTVGEYPSKPRK